jgi:cytoskeletal protein CcmA (bactofilin family)
MLAHRTSRRKTLKLRRKHGSDDFRGFLDHGTSLTGELQFSGTLRIDGNVHGSIKTDDLLIVGERATLHADIKAGEVQVFGAVFGSVESARRVEIYSSGRVKGDVISPQLIIEEGGAFEGRSLTGEEEEDAEARSEGSSSYRKDEAAAS